MQQRFRNNKDFWAGMIFLMTGATAMFISRNYRFGSTMKMGPGYFPTILGGVLILFGIYIIIRGLLSNEKIEGGWSGRVMILLPLSLVLFGFLMENAGFITALVVLVVVSAASGNEFKIVEALVLSVFLVCLSIAVFLWGLGLPYPLIKNF